MRFGTNLALYIGMNTETKNTEGKMKTQRNLKPGEIAKAIIENAKRRNEFIAGCYNKKKETKTDKGTKK